MFLRLGLTIPLVALGCSGPPPSESHITGYTAKQRLGEFAELYRTYQLASADHRPPARLQDLERSKKGFAMGYESAARGDIIVQWGATLGVGSAVLAFEKDAPSQGGWVLLQSGDVQRMTLAQFRAAARAQN